VDTKFKEGITLKQEIMSPIKEKKEERWEI